ncbi:MAG: 4-hydroxy-tetrahydrodipicolinate synthase [Anaerovoracaceae bacterium]|jgi:4-hydroxy-tetrahydrodipicolinate synthase
MIPFTGSCVALVTPFTEDGKIDYEALETLIERQISQGIDAISVCGTTGEASTLKNDEHVSVVKFTMEKTAGRVPVIAGAGSNDTDQAIKMSLALEDLGVDGLLLVTPYYNRCTQSGLITHYLAIADETETPIILYSVPSRTGVNIDSETVAELSGHPRIIGIKEASGNLSQIVDMAPYISSDFAIYSGNDDVIVPILSLGGSGTISTIANLIPADTHRMIEKYMRGDTEGAARLQIGMKPLIDAMFCEVNPIPVKAALASLGLIKQSYRLPLTPPSESSMDRIRQSMKEYGLVPTT